MGNRTKAYLVSQFGNPRGVLGALAGQIMRRRASNVKRNLWTVALMDLRPTDRVLEIGYGPGFALGEVCKALPQGSATGLGRSETMLKMASRKNRNAIRSGRLGLALGSVEDTAPEAKPVFSQPFDIVYAVNVVLFWRDPVSVLRFLSTHLNEDEKILLTFQPRCGARTDEAAMQAGEQIAEQMRSVGLVDVRIETLKEVSPRAVCVIGNKAGA